MAPQGLRQSKRERLGTCTCCGAPLYGIARCTRRRCPGYQYLWVRDNREILHTNLSAYDEGNGTVILATITGPGARQLPWDERACRGLGPHECSGNLGCLVNAEQAIAFNLTASKRLATMHRLAAQAVQRRVCHRPVVLARVWERQRRGVVHAHLVLGCGTDTHRNAARAYLARLHELAPRHGFGFAHSRASLREPIEAAIYCSKALRETVRDPSSPRVIVWISRRLTTRTGCIVQALRQRRTDYATQITSAIGGA